MPLKIEMWGPPLAPLTGGNLYDRILVETLRHRGHEVAVREVPGDREGARADRSRADVIVQDELLHREFRRRNTAGEGRRPRLVALVHHPQSSEPERGEAELRRLREEEGAYLRTVDAVLAPSRASAAAARELAGRPLPFAVAPPGRDRFAGAALPSLPGADEIRTRAAGPLRAAFVGNLIPRKRLIELLEAVAAVPDWTLAIAGREDVDREYAARARERAAAPDLSGRVTFRGALGPEPLAALLRESCLLAVPSTQEGFGIVYLEGFAFGLPALAAASGGAAEIVNGETGWLVRPQDSGAASAAIADRLRLLATDRNRLAAMAESAMRRHRIHPTWDESAAVTEEFLAGIDQ
jgi:glycosyltransferase involved in cell wall biosynthesis